MVAHASPDPGIARRARLSSAPRAERQEFGSKDISTPDAARSTFLPAMASPVAGIAMAIGVGVICGLLNAVFAIAYVVFQREEVRA